jgi:hypothetical protein
MLAIVALFIFALVFGMISSIAGSSESAHDDSAQDWTVQDTVIAIVLVACVAVPMTAWLVIRPLD